MEPLVDSLNHFALSWVCYFFSATWQSTLVGGFLLIVVWMCRKLPAIVRYSILLLALMKFVIPPMVSIPTGVFHWTVPVVELQPSLKMFLPSVVFTENKDFEKEHFYIVQASSAGKNQLLKK